MYVLPIKFKSILIDEYGQGMECEVLVGIARGAERVILGNWGQHAIGTYYLDRDGSGRVSGFLILFGSGHEFLDFTLG